MTAAQRGERGKGLGVKGRTDKRDGDVDASEVCVALYYKCVSSNVAASHGESHQPRLVISESRTTQGNDAVAAP